MAKVSIIGLGYVGRSLAKAASGVAGLEVIGVDRSGRARKDAESDGGSYEITDHMPRIAGSDIYVVCVATPLTDGYPNDQHVIAAAKAIEKHATPGALAILESTVQIGIMEKEFNPVISRAGMLAAFSPERINPGDTKATIHNTPKIVSGMTPEAIDKAVAFYSMFVDNVVRVDDVRVAEASKLLENSYRLLNISFINEFAMSCKKAGIDPKAVIEAASTKGFGFEPFYPGAGVGGHCIPVDPGFLTYYMSKLGMPLTILESAMEFNDSMPDKIVLDLQRSVRQIENKRILIVGMAYKPDVNDTRNSPGSLLYEKLRAMGYSVSWHDEVVKTYNHHPSTPIDPSFDVIVVTIKHEGLDLSGINESKIFDYSA